MTRPSQWRISYPVKNGVPLTEPRWGTSLEEQDERRSMQIEFAEKLAAFMRENGYSGIIRTPYGIPDVKVEKSDDPR